MTQHSALYQKGDENANQDAPRSERRRRRRWLLLMAVVLIVGGGAAAYLRWGRPADGRLVRLDRGTIRSTVRAGGEVFAVRRITISSRVAGEIASVPVAVGQEVVSGTVLVTIAADALQYRVRDAALRVDIARLRLEQARAGVRPEEIAAAEADLTLAESRLAALRAGARPEDIALARQDVVQAEAALEQARQSAAAAVETARLSWETAANALRNAQDAYSRIYWENERLRQQGIELPQSLQDAETVAWRQVQDAEAAMEQARLTHEAALADQEAAVTMAEARLQQARTRLKGLLSGPTDVELAQAQAQVDRARANLEVLRAGAGPEVQLVEKELALAELSLEQAQSDLAKTTITAPFGGTVVEVQVKPGEMVGVNSPLLALADMGQFEILARVDEVDVGQLAVGQSVTVTLDAYPGRPLRGSVTQVSLMVTVEGGSAYYATHVALDPDALAGSGQPPVTLRLGMAANLTILTLERENVLRVPRAAVSRAGAGYYVKVMRGGRPESVRVTLGAADVQYYEVVAGLEEGDLVLLPESAR